MFLAHSIFDISQNYAIYVLDGTDAMNFPPVQDTWGGAGVLV